ncbi:hypothetical protein INR49_005286 [Caranx melampygus]|nr:hypothetical protein INR49_005286 [Caranx melampygus]
MVLLYHSATRLAGLSGTQRSMAPINQQQLQWINHIAEDLSSSERSRVFYLCGSQETDNSVACVKEMLKSEVMVHERGGWFLAELLFHLRRFDILRRVCGASRQEVERTLQCQQVLPRFRVLMAHLSEDMASEDLKNNLLDVIIELEKLDLVSPDRVDFVQKCFAEIGRRDLARKVANYKMSDSYSSRLHLDSVRTLFTAETCPMLAGKPKLFFIQRYSVPEFQPCARMQHCDEDLETDGCDGLSRYDCIPTDADVFWSHCWTDEYQLEQGHHRSVYLKALTDALLKGQKSD